MDSRKVLVACLVAILHFMRGAYGASDWGYFGSHGPLHWGDNSQTCNGRDQSPINIVPSTTKMDTNIPEFSFTKFDSTDVSLLLLNNGHTAQMNIGGDLKISGGGLNGEYVVAQLHFHWGNNLTVGSEHKVNDEHFPMEMHIVTYKESHDNVTNALSQKDGLAVLGFFFQVEGDTHPGFEKLISVLPYVEAKGSNHTVAPFKIEELLPKDFPDFYRYFGSLTTPTCNEVVTWTVFAETIKITAQQLAAFRSLEAGETNDEGNYKMYNNYRPVQNLNGRTVTANFNPSTGYRPSFQVHLMILPVLLAFGLRP